MKKTLQLTGHKKMLEVMNRHAIFFCRITQDLKHGNDLFVKI